MTMKIQINEVWNSEGRSVKIGEITMPDQRPAPAFQAVRDWITANRPDLSLADSIYAHGYHAIAVRQ